MIHTVRIFSDSQAKNVLKAAGEPIGDPLFLFFVEPVEVVLELVDSGTDRERDADR